VPPSAATRSPRAVNRTANGPSSHLPVARSLTRSASGAMPAGHAATETSGGGVDCAAAAPGDTSTSAIPISPALLPRMALPYIVAAPGRPLPTCARPNKPEFLPYADDPRRSRAGVRAQRSFRCARNRRPRGAHIAGARFSVRRRHGRTLPSAPAPVESAGKRTSTETPPLADTASADAPPPYALRPAR
jgi:hypothetical protein